MTPGERAAVIAEIVDASPRGLGLPANVQANLEAMGDAELSSVREKLERLRGYVRVSASGQPDLAARRAEFAARRRERYAKIAEITSKQLLQTESASPPARTWRRASGASPGPVLVDANLLAALHTWRNYDRNRDFHYVETTRRAVHSWIQDVCSKAYDRPDFHQHIYWLLENSLATELNNYLEASMDRMGRDTLRMVINYLAQGPREHSPAFGQFVPEFLARSALVWETLEPSFVSLGSGRMRDTNAIESLAKLRIFSTEFKPDLIVCASRAGRIVGDFLGMEVELKSSLVRTLEVRRNKVEITGGWTSIERHREKYRRVLLLDDIAGVEALCEAHQHLSRYVQADGIQVVALGSSVDVLNRLTGEGHTDIFVPYVSDPAIEVPWDREGTYSANTRSHVFGGGRDGELRVPRAQLRRVTASLEQEAAEFLDMSVVAAK